jgi:hypothetical protein
MRVAATSRGAPMVMSADSLSVGEIILELQSWLERGQPAEWSFYITPLEAALYKKTPKADAIVRRLVQVHSLRRLKKRK